MEKKTQLEHASFDPSWEWQTNPTNFLKGPSNPKKSESCEPKSKKEDLKCFLLRIDRLDLLQEMFACFYIVITIASKKITYDGMEAATTNTPSAGKGNSPYSC